MIKQTLEVIAGTKIRLLCPRSPNDPGNVVNYPISVRITPARVKTPPMTKFPLIV